MGSIGHFGSFSFQSSKTIACGEGGAIVGSPLRGRVLIVDDSSFFRQRIRKELAAAGASTRLVPLIADVRDALGVKHKRVAAAHIAEIDALITLELMRLDPTMEPAYVNLETHPLAAAADGRQPDLAYGQIRIYTHDW